MNLNLFEDDDDVKSSVFAENLKKETYDPLIIAFDSITSVRDKQDKQAGKQDKDGKQDRDGKQDKDGKQGTSQLIHILNQKMIVEPNASSLPVDLNEAQKNTQNTSCDYLVYVPTSFDVVKEKVDAFYETEQQFKKMFGKLNMNNAAATVFMQWDMFQRFVKYANQYKHKRALQWIEESFIDANINKQIVVNDMKNVRNLSNLTAANNTVNLDEKGYERFVIVYTTPVSTGIPLTTVNSLQYLPLAEKFNPAVPSLLGGPPTPAGPFYQTIPQKSLTYYCNYFQLMYMKNDRTNNIHGSFGRITNYLPPLNSKMADTTATYIDYINAPNQTPVRYASPSYNVEIVTNFLRGIITARTLPNREVLRNDNKLKIIQEKTRLYTFKSTPEYSLNYEKLLERLHYKYPCHLTSSASITKEAKVAIKNASNEGIPGAANYVDFIGRAIGAAECDKTKSYSIICAVAIATREFIYYDATQNGGATADDILTHLFTNIMFNGVNPINAGGQYKLKPQLQAHLNAYNLTGPGQLRPLIGAACAAGDAVYAAAKLAVTNYVKENAVAATNAPASKDPALAAIQNAMDFEIDNLDNFAAFAYDNDALLSLMKYSDKTQSTGGVDTPANARNPNVAENLLPHANYLKTLYTSKDTEIENEKQNLTPQQQQKTEFETIHDDELYVICGPVYFDYTWIFKQNPELIHHILGKLNDNDLKQLREGWTMVEDPLTENKYHINPKPEESSYPKMRFDNPTKLPSESNEKTNSDNTGSYTYVWKEQYVSPSQATMDKTVTQLIRRGTNATTQALQYNNPQCIAMHRATTTWFTNIQPQPNNVKIMNAIYNWTTPGYYQYECTQKITRRNPRGVKTKWENKHIQLMRPPTYENSVQDFTEPNLPTAYPPPLMSIVPPFRGPGNTFVIHAWFPGKTFAAKDGKLNQRACMDYMYKMMQLIFKTADKNASEIISKKRTCLKIMVIGYELEDRNLNVFNSSDKQFIGDAFFSAIRDYSMLYESTIRVTLYYDTKSQQTVKMRYDDYVNQRLSVLRKSNPLAIDTSLHLKIANIDDFFTLKWYPDSDQLIKDDLLYFVDYCSTPRAFIGNMGEWPENIEEVMDQAINVPAGGVQPLVTCLQNAFTQIQNLYIERGIKEKMSNIMPNLQQWNVVNPLQLVNSPSSLTMPMGGFNTLMKTLDDVSADSGAIGEPQIGSSTPNTLLVSWWIANNHQDARTIIPRNAYISSFDEHVMILHNLLSNSDIVDANIGGVNAGWATNAYFDISSLSSTVNHGPYVASSFSQNRNGTFENAVYAYTQAKKILTLLSKMKYDEIQISKTENEKINAALAALNVKMSWSMDAKFTAAVAEGAFIPNSSALHNPFMCPALLDPKEWQFMDFDDVGVREIAGADPITPMLKPFIDSKIKGGTSAVATSRALIISKQPNVDRLKKNVEVILENMFHRNEPMRYAGKTAVFNNYAWNKKLFYKKRNDKVALQQLNYTNKTPDFARLMGLRPSGKCINFPLFAIHLTMYLYQGNLSDMTGMDVARLSCSLDGNMFKTNAQIIWDQMMKNLKEKEKNFTIAQVLSRLGRPVTTEEYVYTAEYADAPAGNAHSEATQLKTAAENATNATLKTTNVETLKKIQTEVTKMNLLASPLYTGPNDVGTLVANANAYNNATLTAVNTMNATLGWNAANQRESTVLYMNKKAKKNGSIQNIEPELISLKAGDKIMITVETLGTRLNPKQVWLVTGPPRPNTTYPTTIIDVPVTYALVSATNVLARISNDIIANASPLTVALERFVQDEEMD